MDKIYTFGDFELDQSKHEVLSKVTNKKLIGFRCGILDFLITNREQPIEKTALVNAVWSPGARVEDGTVRNHVSHIRTWLRKNSGGETATYIPPGGYDGKYQFVFKPVSERPCSAAQGGVFPFTASPYGFALADYGSLVFAIRRGTGQQSSSRQAAHVLYPRKSIAYWLHFYSLFFDTLYVPAHHILDNKFTADIFEALNIHNKESPIRAGRDGPFPGFFGIPHNLVQSPAFSKLLSHLEGTASYVSDRPQDGAVFGRFAL